MRYTYIRYINFWIRIQNHALEVTFYFLQMAFLKVYKHYNLIKLLMQKCGFTHMNLFLVIYILLIVCGIKE